MLLLSYLFYGIIAQFNVKFASDLKPITLRDIKNTINFLIKQLCKPPALFPSLSQILFETISLLLEGHFCINYSETLNAQTHLNHFISTKLKAFLQSNNYIYTIDDQITEDNQKFQIGFYSQEK